MKTWWKSGKRKKCSLCKRRRITDESAVLRMQCADGVHDMVICDECLSALSPAISGIDL